MIATPPQHHPEGPPGAPQRKKLFAVPKPGGAARIRSRMVLARILLCPIAPAGDDENNGDNSGTTGTIDEK